MATFHIARGTTLPITTTITSNGAAVNLSGCRVLFTLKINPTDADASAVALLDNLTLGGVTVAKPATGVANIVVPASATYNLPPIQIRLYYEIWVKDSLGNEFRTENGDVIVDWRILVQQP